MDFTNFANVWEDFLKFLDRAFQWLKLIFSGEDLSQWPPKDYPDINAPAEQ